MFKHAHNTNLNLHNDYRLTADDVKTYQHNWTQSVRLVSKIAREQRWGVLKNY